MKKNLWGERSLVFGISLLLIGTGFFPPNDEITSSKRIQGSVRDSPPPVEWNHTYPPPLGNSGGNCIQQTPDGGYIITGYAGGGNAYAFYLLKIDAQGNEQWNRTFGSGYTEANWVEVTDDNGYILTGRDCKWIDEQETWVEDIWIIKTDEYGYEEWNWTRMTLYNDWGTCIKQTSDGGFIANDIASDDTYNFSLIKFDASGNVLWETNFENKWVFSFTLTPNDDILLTGFSEYALLLMKMDENGTMEWEQEFFQDLWPDCRGNDVHVTPDGGYIIGGSTSTYSSSDLLLLKTDENGVEQWHQTYGSSGTDWGTSVALLENGDYILGGTHLGLQGVAPDRFWLLRTTPAGNIIWSQYYLPLENARCSCVQQTSENGVIASGAINVDTGATCIVLKLSNHTGNQPPYTPSNPNPSDGMINVEVNATLSWIGSDPNPDDILTYDVYFGMNNTPAKMVSNQTELMYCPGTMEYSTTYYWRIVAWDTGNAFTAGPLWHFTTIPSTNQPPYTPKNPCPPDGATNVSIQTNLKWTGGDPDEGDKVQYGVFFGTNPEPPCIALIAFTNATQLDWNFDENLQYATTYYWKISAMDNHYAHSVGPIWSFTTESDIIPPNITNVTANPPIQYDNREVNISCDVSDNVAIHEVWINITYPDSTTQNTSMAPGYYNNQTYSQIGTYKYFIWANDTNNNSNISTGHTFQIILEPFHAFFAGVISHLNDSEEDCISFQATLVFFMIFNPYNLGRVIPNEKIWVSKEYKGHLGSRFILGLFDVVATEYP